MLETLTKSLYECAQEALGNKQICRTNWTSALMFPFYGLDVDTSADCMYEYCDSLDNEVEISALILDAAREGIKAIKEAINEKN